MNKQRIEEECGKERRLTQRYTVCPLAQTRSREKKITDHHRFRTRVGGEKEYLKKGLKGTKTKKKNVIF